jgi:hypothetical protein
MWSINKNNRYTIGFSGKNNGFCPLNPMLPHTANAVWFHMDFPLRELRDQKHPEYGQEICTKAGELAFLDAKLLRDAANMDFIGETFGENTPYCRNPFHAGQPLSVYDIYIRELAAQITAHDHWQHLFNLEPPVRNQELSGTRTYDPQDADMKGVNNLLTIGARRAMAAPYTLTMTDESSAYDDDPGMTL